MISSNCAARSGCESNRIGCLLEKVFYYNGLTIEGEGSSNTRQSIMRPISPPLVDRYENSQILRIPVSANHFLGNCTAHKRPDCPLLVGHRFLIKEHSELAFSFYDSVMGGYKAWIMENWIEGVALLAGQAMEACKIAFEKGFWADDDGIIDNIRLRVDDGSETSRAMSSLNNGLKQMVAAYSSESDKYGQRWLRRIGIGRQIVHDTNSIIAASVQTLDMAKYLIANKRFMRAYEILNNHLEGTPHNLANMIKLIIGFERYDAERKGVDIRVGRLPNVEIASSVRLQLLRAVNELIRNSIKYSDPDDRKQSHVWIDTDISDDGWLSLSIEDNGVGIRDVESAMNVGYRERPDLALGEGIGLSSVRDIVERSGWRLGISSKLGQGTKATLGIKISGASGIVSAAPEYSKHSATSSTTLPSDAVKIPPPPPLPREFIDVDFSKAQDPVDLMISSESPLITGGMYLYLSIPAPIALCG